MKRLINWRILIPAGIGLALAACETPPPAPPPAPPLMIQTPPPPPPLPDIALTPQIYEFASTYRAAMAVAAGIEANFSSADDVSNAVSLGASYEQVQLQRGAIAYAAVAALQEPSFIQGIREIAVEPSVRRQLASRIMANPSYAAQMPNAELAAGLAVAAINGTGAQVTNAGVAVKQSAYDLQGQRWANANVQNAEARLELAKDLSGQERLANAAEVEALRQATVGQAALSLAGEPVAPPYSTTINRALAVAALAVLGRAGEDNADYVLALLEDQETAFCLNLAKLNYYQCLAVSRPQFEDIFCLGQHAMIDTGQCMSLAAGANVADLSVQTN